MNYNLLYPLIHGVGMDDPVWGRTVFCANCERLLSESVARDFFVWVRCIAERKDLVSDDRTWRLLARQYQCGRE